MVDIQSATAEIRRGIKKKKNKKRRRNKPQDKNIMSASATQGGHNKISGKRSPAEVKHLQVGGNEITTVADIADTRGIVFRDLCKQTLFIRILVTQSPC